ncbi:MAG: DUF488 domain-containing protein [Acidobacteria bacterium]|nr:DUF488 domain-containing protein [Acidobacteriota bacterium]
MTLYSIGHSNVSIDAFLELLRRHQIGVLVDARSQPFSRYNPHFSRESLRRAIEGNGIQYVFLGDRIGGKPKDNSYRLADGRVDYEKLASSALYLEGIELLVKLGESNNVCFMCAEADFKKCHRYWLITRTLVARDIVVKHILHSGELVNSNQSDFETGQLRLFT